MRWRPHSQAHLSDALPRQQKVLLPQNLQELFPLGSLWRV